MLFDLQPVFDLRWQGDTLTHFTDRNGIMRATVNEQAGGWAWGASDVACWPESLADIDWEEGKATGTAPTREEAMEAALAWLRARL